MATKDKKDRNDYNEEKGVKTVDIPSSILRDRTLSPLESITAYLKDQTGISFHEIALLLNRDDRTIWTCYNRAQKKLYHK